MTENRNKFQIKAVLITEESGKDYWHYVLRVPTQIALFLRVFETEHHLCHATCVRQMDKLIKRYKEWSNNAV